MRLALPFAFACAALVAAAPLTAVRPLFAQAPLVLPKQSPRASVSQTVGLTTVSITYDRPAVNGRQIWGKLVPFDTVWRAGANENTVIEFSSPVRVGGQTLKAGRYGLHMIPAQGDWTIILSRQANAWGSFSYDPKEDALRFTVTPAPADMHERLAYTLDDPTESSVVATLRSEKLAVPFTVEVDSAINENFTNLRVKAALLGQRGDEAGAAAAAQRSLAIASEAEMNTYGYLLMGQGKVDSAIVVFRKNTKDHPKSWNTYDSLAKAYTRSGPADSPARVSP
jgi:hypothetical protein